MTAELDRIKNDFILKNSDLTKVNDDNARVKAANFDKKIEELTRQLHNLEKQRTEFQNKLENIHNAFECKLQLYVTDMGMRSMDTQKELGQIKDLLAKLQQTQDKHADLLQKRGEIRLEIHEQNEKGHVVDHLNNQSQDLDQMIKDAED